MKKLCSATDLPQAHLLLDKLQQAGIAARVFNENMQGGLGEIPFTHTWPEIWLENEDDHERAQMIIREFEQTTLSTESVNCPACGESNPANFETCWQCGATLE